MALVNPATGNSLTFNGTGGKTLLTQPFSYGSVDEDAWYIVQGSNTGSFRIAYPLDNTQTFNDFGGREQPGDNICIFNDQNPNSLWQVNVVG
jgi:hypothetical protein